MIGESGYMTAVPKHALEGMIDVVKGIEPELGYGSILQVSRIRRTKTVCTYCGVGCSLPIPSGAFNVFTKSSNRWTERSLIGK